MVTVRRRDRVMPMRVMCKFRKTGLRDVTLGAMIFASGVWLILSGLADLLE